MEDIEMSEQFLKIYDEFADLIFRHCYFKVSDREKARDLTQDTFIRTWKYMVDGRQVDNIKAFLYRIADNLIIDEYRKKKVESLDKLQEQGLDIVGEGAGIIINFAEVKKVMKVIQKLDPLYREVIVMRFVEDLTPKEIAQAINESENVVSVRIHRGLKKLREIINGQP